MITLGADIEMFITGKDGYLKSGIELISGTKEKPCTIDGVAISHDNVALEFAIPIARSIQDAANKIGHALQVSRDVIGRNILIDAPSLVFPEKLLKHPEAQRFGCEPDYDVYAMTENCTKNPSSGLRSAGAHQHFGDSWLTENPYNSVRFAKWLDATEGVVGVLADPSMEAKRRRELYGKAGCVRIKSYGVEYRTLSSWWIRSPTTTLSALGKACDALFLCQKEGGTETHTQTLDHCEHDTGFNIRNSINSCDETASFAIAEWMDSKFGLGLVNFAMQTVCIKTPIEKNWK